MTDAVSGMSGTIWVCATVGGTYVKLAELIDLRLRVNGREIDTSNVDDLGWGSSIQGVKSWEVTPSGNFIIADTAYGILKDAIITGDGTTYVKALSSGTPTSTPVGWSGQARVMDMDITLAGTNTQQKAAWSLKGVGAITELP